MRRASWSKVTRPARSWKNAAARANVATVRAMTLAIDSPPAPHRVESETSAAMTTEALLSWSNSRVTRGLKLVSVDCAQSMADGPVAGLPVAQAREVVAGAVDEAGVDAPHQILHAPPDDELDVPYLLPRHQRVVGVEAHGMGTRSTMSAMTSSTRTPRPAAWGASQMRWPST